MNWSSALSISALLISTIALIGAMQNMNTQESEKTKLKNEEVFNDLAGHGKTENKAGVFSVKMVEYVPPTSLTFACGTNKEVVKIYFDGRVEIANGVSLPEASKIFWNAIGNGYQEFKQTIISQYEKEKENE